MNAADWHVWYAGERCADAVRAARRGPLVRDDWTRVAVHPQDELAARRSSRARRARVPAHR